jgi:hypothetical protein
LSYGDGAWLYRSGPKPELLDWEPLYVIGTPDSARECATCHAVLADGPQPAATYTAQRQPEQDGAKTMREALIAAKCTSPDGTYVQASMDEVLAVVVHSRPNRGTP